MVSRVIRMFKDNNARRGSPRRLVRASLTQPKVGIIMGSQSDWDTMREAAQTLEALGVVFEVQVVSAHRTPHLLFEYSSSAEGRGLEVIIAGAGGAAHLPGMCASLSNLPVLGVPVESRVLRGVDSLLSIVQMPAGIPVATFAIGTAGAINAALFAAAIVARSDSRVRAALLQHRTLQTDTVLSVGDPRASKRLVAGGRGAGERGKDAFSADPRALKRRQPQGRSKSSKSSRSRKPRGARK